MEIDHASQTIVDGSGVRVKLPKAVLAKMEAEFDRASAYDEFSRRLMNDPDFKRCLAKARAENLNLRLDVVRVGATARKVSADEKLREELSPISRRSGDSDLSGRNCAATASVYWNKVDAYNDAKAAWETQLAHDDSVYEATVDALPDDPGGDEDPAAALALEQATYWNATHIQSDLLQYQLGLAYEDLDWATWWMDYNHCYVTLDAVQVIAVGSNGGSFASSSEGGGGGSCPVFSGIIWRSDDGGASWYIYFSGTAQLCVNAT